MSRLPLFPLAALLLLPFQAEAQFQGTLIMIDSGHGGTDPGSLGIDGAAYPNEEDFVLDVAQRLEALLQNAGAEVILTRTTDSSVSLTSRRSLADALDPDVFLSLHCNSFADSSVSGVETYHWSFGDARDIALATTVQTRMVEAFPLIDRGVKEANFTVLTANPPSALAEMLFISNPVEFGLMNTAIHREQQAAALYRGIAGFLGIDLTTPVLTLQPQSLTANPGSSVSFNAASTTPGVVWQWLRNGVPVTDGPDTAGATTSTLNLSNVTPDKAGFYTALLTGAGVPLRTNAAQLVVAAPASIPGSGQGLRASYYNNENFTSLQIVRTDPAVDFDWQTGSPAAAIQPDTYSVRWMGQLEPRYTQTYTFHALTSDGVRLWIDGNPVIHNWRYGTPFESTGSIALTAGKKVDLVMEYSESSGDAVARLSWSSPSQLKEIIPSSQLHRPPPVLGGPSEFFAIEGSTVTFSTALLAGDPVKSVQTLTDFENFTIGMSDLVLFRRPALAGGTLGFIDTTMAEKTSIVSDFPPNSSLRALQAEWSFKSNAVLPWLRLSTSNAPNLGNPIVDFSKGLSFDIWTLKPMRVGIGLRETNSSGAIGSNGGTTGTTEFLGVPTLSPRPEPTRLIPASQWTTVGFVFPSEPVQPFTGNGILTSSTGKGVLEQIVLVPDGQLGPQIVILDNFLLTEPNALTWSLVNPVPGVSIHPRTGLVTWQAPAGTGATPVQVSLRATDNESPPLSAIRTVKLTPLPFPEILSYGISGETSFAISWRSSPDAVYFIETSEDLSGPWQRLLPAIIASGPVTSWSGPLPFNRRFHRIRLEVPVR